MGAAITCHVRQCPWGCGDFNPQRASRSCGPTAEQREGGSGGVPTQHEAHQECSCTAHVWVVPANLQWCADVVGVAQMATTVSKTRHSARSDKKVRKLLFQICTGNSTALYPICFRVLNLLLFCFVLKGHWGGHSVGRCKLKNSFKLFQCFKCFGVLFCFKTTLCVVL